VVAPATPADNGGLLKSAIRSDDPVVFMEHKNLWPTSAELDHEIAPVPLGKAAVVSAGSDVTLVTWSATRFVCEAAVASARAAGISVELIDLRTLWPWDRDTVLGSVARTRRLMVAHEAVQVCGVGAELIAAAVEALGPGIAVRRLGAPRIPVAYAPNLEAAYHVSADQILAALRGLI